MKTFILMMLLGISTVSLAQVAIGINSVQPDPSAMLDVTSTTRGLLLPRMTQAQRNAIVNPATGLMIYQTDATPGYYYNAGIPATPAWVRMVDLNLPYTGTVYAPDAAFSITNTNWETSGAIYGASNSFTGYGVYGISPLSGVYGEASTVTANGTGVQGRASSPQGTGVYGSVVSTTGNSTGVFGTVNSATGKGVYGLATATTGMNYGVYGASSSASGQGVHGVAPNQGVYGKATATSGFGAGVKGETLSSSGYGVVGVSPYVGVVGEATTGIGVLGSSPLSSGTYIGVKGVVNSPNSFSGYFEGGKVFVEGRLGIHTTSPGAGLHLKATGFPESFMFLEATDNQDAGIRLYEGSLDQWHIFNSASADGLHIYNRAGSTAFFAKQTNGYVAIGSTDPTQMLDVTGTIRVRGLTTGAVAGTVSRTADGTLITSSSDARLKTDIQFLKNSLDKVLRLQGVSYLWKDNPGMGRRIGFVAQEFERVLPELSFTNPADGYKGINYAEVTAVLVEALKELNLRHEKLQQEVQQLKALLVKLQGSKTDQ